MKTVVVLLLTGLMLAGQTAKADKPPRYRLIVLPLRLDNPTGRGGCLNNKGQVVGTVFAERHFTSEGRQPNRLAVLWQKGRSLRQLPIPRTAPFPNSPPFPDCYPVCINDKGQVAGEFYSQDSGAITITESQAFVWQNGRMTQITGLPGDGYSAALGMNNKGAVVGTFNNNLHAVEVPPGADVSFPHAFLYQGNKRTSLGLGIACGINEREEIIGEDAGKGMLWSNSRWTGLDMDPSAINQWGWIAGNQNVLKRLDHSHQQTVTVACLWKKGHVIVLGKPNSHAYALNNRGQVVGQAEMSQPHEGSDEHAVLWQQGKAYDLNHCVRLPKGWTLTMATSVNDQGWIIGQGYVDKISPQGLPEDFTFLLTPRSPHHSITASTWTADLGRRSSRTAGTVTRLTISMSRKASL